MLTAKIANSRGGDLDLRGAPVREAHRCRVYLEFPVSQKRAKVVRRQRWLGRYVAMSFRSAHFAQRPVVPDRRPRSRRRGRQLHRARADQVLVDRPLGRRARGGCSVGDARAREPCACSGGERRRPGASQSSAERRSRSACSSGRRAALRRYVIGVVTLAAATVRLVMADGTTVRCAALRPSAGFSATGALLRRRAGGGDDRALRAGAGLGGHRSGHTPRVRRLRAALPLRTSARRRARSVGWGQTP